MSDCKYNRDNNTSSCSPYMIWRNYAIGMISIAIVPLLCGLAQISMYPLVTLAISFSLFLFVRMNRGSKSESCALIPYIAARTLLVFTFLSVILVLCLQHSDKVVIGNAMSMSVLILSPIALAVLLVAKKKSINNTLCVDCMLRKGTPYERAVLGHFYFRENKYLVPHLLKIFFLIFLVASVYLLFNLDLHRELGFTDYAIYVYFPVACLIGDVVYLSLRYMAIGIYYKQLFKQNSINVIGEGVKIIRVLLVCGERVFYKSCKDGKFDTPFEFSVDYSPEISVENVRQKMSEILGFLPDGCTQLCYSTQDPINRKSIEHYFCFIDNSDGLSPIGITGEWLCKAEIEEAFGNDDFSKMASSEIHRVYTIMSTSKKFYINGDRKIKIKGYTPSFSISELRNSNVDFNDNRWMVLSRFNKDRLFYRIKILWYKYIEGLG